MFTCKHTERPPNTGGKTTHRLHGRSVVSLQYVLVLCHGIKLLQIYIWRWDLVAKARCNSDEDCRYLILGLYNQYTASTPRKCVN